MSFNNKVLALVPEGSKGAKRVKTQSRTVAIFWLGKVEKSDEHVVATIEGVVRLRAVQACGRAKGKGVTPCQVAIHCVTLRCAAFRCSISHYSSA